MPEIGASVFIIPEKFGGRRKKSGVKNGVKNGDERVVVMNDVARRVLNSQRGLHPELVFPYLGRERLRMNDTAWRKARIRAGERWLEEFGTDPHPDFVNLRVHDLKHTFGRRLRAAGVDLEMRQALLGHKSRSVTTHYSGAELASLIEAANKVSATDSRTPTLTILKRSVR